VKENWCELGYRAFQFPPRPSGTPAMATEIEKPYLDD
jgi:hypothetical protein